MPNSGQEDADGDGVGKDSIPGWQKLCVGTKDLRKKVRTQTKILSPNIRYFVAILTFVAIYAFYKAFIELKM